MSTKSPDSEAYYQVVLCYGCRTEREYRVRATERELAAMVADGTAREAFGLLTDRIALR